MLGGQWLLSVCLRGRKYKMQKLVWACSAFLSNSYRHCYWGLVVFSFVPTWCTDHDALTEVLKSAKKAGRHVLRAEEGMMMEVFGFVD